VELALGGVIVTIAPFLNVWFATVVNEAIVLLVLAITIMLVMLGASLQLLLPFWEAVMVAVPAPRIVTMLLDRLMLPEAEL
jgi:hypothetical protein